jgi:hypothetical protein
MPLADFVNGLLAGNPRNTLLHNPVQAHGKRRKAREETFLIPSPCARFDQNAIPTYGPTWK